MDAGDLVKDGWFHERNALWPGQAMSLEVLEVIHRERSGLQDIFVFDSTNHGRVLVLDGIIMLTERDECAYHEMLAHVPMTAHGNAGRVCVVGGGDGGIVREVLKHVQVQHVTLCEIDARVIQVCKQYLPKLACALNDPRVHIVSEDGAVYLKKHSNQFDVIITDSSDPIGPAVTLFQDEYIDVVHGALREDGVMCAQGECMWLHISIIRPMLQHCRQLFRHAHYAYTCVPTYPSGQIGFIVAAKDQQTHITQPKSKLAAHVQALLKYYSNNVHKAAFVLPPFVERALGANHRVPNCNDVEEKRV